jgi:phosphoribosylformylglycinamidine synthase subunit PurQ / glutaminase
VKPNAIVLSAPGTNRDHDVAHALELAGAAPHITRLAELCGTPSLLNDTQLVVIAGGFSHADALGAGRMFALQLEQSVGDDLRGFVAAGKPVIGICNGFQTLTRLGLLPGALGHNEGGSFQCRWVTLDTPVSACVWTQGLEGIDCPIAHGEGRYVHPDPDALAAAGQVALTYQRNPNGSAADIAGVCDPTGVVLGLMPHPENHVHAHQHPLAARGLPARSGLPLFSQGVAYAAGR